MQVSSPGRPPAEVTDGVGVTELNLNATRRRLALAETPRETRHTRVRFTAAIRVRTVVTLSVDAGTVCGHTGEVTSL